MFEYVIIRNDTLSCFHAKSDDIQLFDTKPAGLGRIQVIVHPDRSWVF